MHPRAIYLFALILLSSAAGAAAASPSSSKTVDLPAETVQDKIRGGLLGHVLGDLNGLKHEFKYINEPGNVTEYTPALFDGAWTDDDTDFEWVYLVEMQRRGQILLPAADIPALWQAHINRFIWCANQYARQLMDLGLEPPLTGMLPFNPWSDFNIAGQFVAESWGLISPGLPRAAARIGLNYTRVSISGEPAQATQLFDAMIATAYLTSDLERILDAGEAAVDPRSRILQLVRDMRAWHRAHPDDWRAARRLLKEKYTRFGGATRDINGYELNTASAIGALLYGRGDFVPTAIAAFNFGWDADNNAAMACTVVGVIKGARWMQAQGWAIKDEFRNTSRDRMPQDETLTRFGDRLIALAELNIAQQGGKIVKEAGKTVYRIPVEAPANIEPLADPAAQLQELRASRKDAIEAALLGDSPAQAKARAAYEAIALDLAGSIRSRHPEAWAGALAALEGHPRMVSALFYEAGTPAGRQLAARALAAGLRKPAKKITLWTAKQP